MLSYQDFLNEITAQTNTAKGFGGLHNANDEDTVGFRNHMLDVFMPLAKDDESIEKRINSIISTFCVATVKELRFDEDLIKELAQITGMEFKEVMKKLQKETDEYYDGFRGNLIGMS